MSLRFAVRVAVVVALGFAATSGCCRTRKGLVLRGDWSLELNRIPHLTSNGPRYKSCCAPTSCTEPACSCADSCTSGCATGCACSRSGDGGDFAQAGGWTSLDGEGGPYADDRYSGEGSAGGFAGAMPGGGFGFGGFGAGVATQGPTPPAPARFQPVPTRPVFGANAAFVEAAIEAPLVPLREHLPSVEGELKSSSFDDASLSTTSLRVMPASYRGDTATVPIENSALEERSSLRIR